MISSAVGRDGDGDGEVGSGSGGVCGSGFGVGVTGVGSGSVVTGVCGSTLGVVGADVAGAPPPIPPTGSEEAVAVPTIVVSVMVCGWLVIAVGPPVL
jgi:hypothetical protein